MKKNHLIQSIKGKFRPSKEGEEQPDNIVEMPETADVRQGEAEDDEDEQVEQRGRNRMGGQLPKVMAAIVVILIIAGIYTIFASQGYNGYEVVEETGVKNASMLDYTPYQNSLLKFSKDGATYVDEKGKAVWNETFAMKMPTADVSGEYAAIADMNGNDVYIFNTQGKVSSTTMPYKICDIAVASQGDQMVHYWMHNNMLTINGQKMAKSLGNFITLEQLFKGTHPLLEQAYSPMTIRFFTLSAHYRGTVDFSNEALQASEKGLDRLMNGIRDLSRVPVSKTSDEATGKFIQELRQRCYDAMNDDLQTPLVISYLFEACHVINTILDHKAQVSVDDLKELTDTMNLFSFDILGLKDEKGSQLEKREKAYGKVVDMVLALRAKAKAAKDWATSDQIRDALANAGFEVKDTKDGVTWKLK